MLYYLPRKASACFACPHTGQFPKWICSLMSFIGQAHSSSSQVIYVEALAHPSAEKKTRCAQPLPTLPSSASAQATTGSLAFSGCITWPYRAALYAMDWCSRGCRSSFTP